MARGDGYNPSTVTNPGAQAAVNKLQSDPEFKTRYLSDDPYIRNFAMDQMSIAQQNASSPSYYVQNQASANAAGGKIKNAYADTLFMERYTPNDPKVRGAAIDEMSALMFQRYGNSPNSDDPVENTPRPIAGHAPTSQPSSMQYTRSAPPATVARNSEAWKIQQLGTAYSNAVKANGGRPIDV